MCHVDVILYLPIHSLLPLFIQKDHIYSPYTLYFIILFRIMDALGIKIEPTAGDATNSGIEQVK